MTAYQTCAAEGVTAFDKYRIEPAQPLTPDLFVPDNVRPPPAAA
jgi:citronellol/citronellal dehydrogenase